MNDESFLLDLAKAISDGTGVDWEAAETLGGGDPHQTLLPDLKDLARIAAFHRRHDAEETVPARKWGQLELLEKIGEGSFGDVYRAWDPTLEREVALKLLRAGGQDSSRLQESVLKEGRLLARIKHPNVATVYGVAEHEGRVGFWMEFVRGKTLKQLLEEQGPMSAREAAGVGIDLCKALSAVHGQGLLHRDIKAQNVIREEGGRIVLMDFGLGDTLSDRTPDRARKGTPLYMAPELWEQLPATPKTDIFALGVLLYLLVTGRFPAEAEGLEDLRDQIERGLLQPCRDLRPDLPSEFVGAIDRCLACPAERFASASQLESRLRSVLSWKSGYGSPRIARNQAGRAAPDHVTRIRVISQYRIEEELAEGGMGIVYKARDTRLGRTVALKLLPEEYSSDPQALHRFQREARATSALNHPNICVVHNVGDYRGRPFIVMEYLEGQTLAERLTGNPLDIEEILHVGMQVADALGAAHARGIIHRDIKPGNIFITQENQVKLLDFGLAKLVEPEEQSAKVASDAETPLTVPDGLVGTVPYMSPEQILGQDLDARSDLFALGAVLYQMATGEQPFRGETSGAVFDQILHRVPPSPLRLNPELPAQLVFTISKALQKNRLVRYQSAAEILEDLRAPERKTVSHGFPESASQEAEVGAGSKATKALPFRGRNRLVERDQELATLRQLIERAASESGALLLVSGEPGIGKTRLAEEAASQARQQGLLVLTGHCYDMGAALPYAPFVEALQELVRQFSSEALRQALDHSGGEITRLLPELLVRIPDLPPPVNLPPEQSRHYLFTQIFEFLDHAARIQPLVMVLEDLHWADQSTSALLQFLTPFLGRMRLLVIGTYRDTDLDDSTPLSAILDQLWRSPFLARIALSALSAKGVSRLVTACSGKRPPASLIQALYRQTEGNPFFVEELYHYLHEEGRLLDPGCRWLSDFQVSESAVPESVRLVILKRLSRLNDKGRELLVSAALIGRRFSFDLLEALANEPDVLYETIEAAERGHLVSRFGDDRHIEYRFVHPLVRQALANEISPPRRRLLHLRLSEAIRKVYAERIEVKAADYAHHLYSAGSLADQGETIRYLRLAGDNALSATAFEEAHGLYEKSLTLLHEQDLSQKAELLFRQGIALSGSGDWVRAQDTWGHALETFEQLKEAGGMAKVSWRIAQQFLFRGSAASALEVCRRVLKHGEAYVSEDWCRVLAWTAHCLAQSGEYEEAHRIANQALAQAQQLENPALVNHLKIHQSSECLYFMQTESQVSIIESTMEYRPAEDWDRIEALSCLQWGYLSKGQLDGVRRVDRELEPLANRMGHLGCLWMANRARWIADLVRHADFDLFRSFAEQEQETCLRSDNKWRSHAYSWLGQTDFWSGNWDKAGDSFHTAVELEPDGFTAGADFSRLLVWHAYMGHREKFEEMLQRCRHRFPQPGKPNTVGRWALLFAAIEGLATLGQWKECSPLYPVVLEALQTGTVIEFNGFGLIAKLAGIAAGAGELWDRAQNHLEDALKESHDIPFAVEQAEVRRWYAGMLLRRGRPEDRDRATKLRQECIKHYKELGMARHRQLALAELPGPPQNRHA